MRNEYLESAAAFSLRLRNMPATYAWVGQHNYLAADYRQSSGSNSPTTLISNQWTTIPTPYNLTLIGDKPYVNQGGLIQIIAPGTYAIVGQLCLAADGTTAGGMMIIKNVNGIETPIDGGNLLSFGISGFHTNCYFWYETIQTISQADVDNVCLMYWKAFLQDDGRAGYASDSNNFPNSSQTGETYSALGFTQIG